MSSYSHDVAARSIYQAIPKVRGQLLGPANGVLLGALEAAGEGDVRDERRGGQARRRSLDERRRRGVDRGATSQGRTVLQ